MKNKISIFIFLITISLVAQTSDFYQDSIKIEIQQIVSDSLRAKKYYKASTYALQNLNDLKLSHIYLDSAMFYSQKSKFSDSEAKCHFLYGLLERIGGNYEVALEHLDKNINYYKNDSTNKSYALFQVGVIHRLRGDYKKSLSTYFEILKIFEHKKDSFAMASTLNSIGNIYGEMDKYDKAIENYSRANGIFIKKDKKRDMSNAYQNIGEIYIRKKDTIAAQDNMKKSLLIAEDINEPYAKANALFGLGRTYLRSHPKKSLEYFKESESILEKIQYNSLKLKVYRDLGHYYRKYNYEKALIYYNKGLALSEELGELPPKEEILEGLSFIYESKKQFQKAYNYQSKYIIVKDSIFNIENTRGLNLLQSQFDSEKKDKEIAQQNLQLVQNEKEFQKKKTQYSYMTGAALILLIGLTSLWFINQQRQKRKNQEILSLKREQQVQTLESLMEGEENERIRISKELHDGVNVDLSAIKYKLTSMLEKNNEVINEVVTMIDKSCEQVRAISHNLVPPSLKDFSLVETIEDFCTTANSIHNSEITFTYIGESISISKKAEVNIFRIVQELVNNSIKHAEATEINVQLSNHNNNIQLTVEDNGKGFNKEEIKSNGIGLKNIQSRVDYLSAKLDFSSNEKGTSYIIDINIEALT
ncbi:tetratricopeptide repeat-containing sensor histidine kinase [Aureibaculum luteum]|uniref:tetratricopeptide repeat-containing sensor histidine kinase n=1 Tax=Aureibaculum luteum TaxID=1548456 RepID=UPI000E4916D7|nr:sensor histidine kinase [Aureibaculum luteum]